MHAGSAASALLLLCFFTAMHTSGPLLLCLGLPLDRSLPWHKLLGCSLMLNVAVHAAAVYARPLQRSSLSGAGKRFLAVRQWDFQRGMQASGAVRSLPRLMVMPVTGTPLPIFDNGCRIWARGCTTFRAPQLYSVVADVVPALCHV